MPHTKALHIVILLASLLLLGACCDSNDMSRLQAIESTIDTDPEEAWHMLDSIDLTQSRAEVDREHAEHQLHLHDRALRTRKTHLKSKMNEDLYRMVFEQTA